MIAALVVYALLIALLAGAAGLVLERCAAWSQGPRRAVWVLAMSLSLLIPALRLLLPAAPGAPLRLELAAAPTTRVATASASFPVAQPSIATDHPVPAAASVAPSGSESRPDTRNDTWNARLRWAWIAASAVLLVGYAALWLRLRHLARGWRREVIDGQRVWVTDGLGPAVCGALHPRIVVPQWVREAPASLQTLILAHERSHIEAADPWLLLLGLGVLILMPWNVPLWWQLRRLRFAIEVDCDARVLRQQVPPRAYAQMLLTVAERHAAAPLASIALAERASRLQRRIRILSSPRRRRSRSLIAGTIALGAACIAGAAVLRAPALYTGAALLKPPYEATLPPLAHFAMAEAVARERYPELFAGHFTGSVEIAVGLDRTGRVLGVEQWPVPASGAHNLLLYPPMWEWFPGSWAQEHGFEPQDILEYGQRLLAWHGPGNVDRLYFSYQVTKWPHDPQRSALRVRNALLARYPQLLTPVAQGGPPPSEGGPSGGLITVVMNDDGTIRHALFSPRTSSGPPVSARDQFQAMGFGPDQLAHRGILPGLWWDALTDQRQAIYAPYTVIYAWPRQPADPPAQPLITASNQPGSYVNSARYWEWIDQQHGIDRALVRRAFPDFWAHGGVSRDAGLWIVLDAQGRVFATGHYRWGEQLHQQLLARFPGIVLGPEYGYGFKTDTGHEAMLNFLWLAPDSPVTSPSQVNASERKDVLLEVHIAQDAGDVLNALVGLRYRTAPLPVAGDGVTLTIAAQPAGAHAATLQFCLRPVSPTASVCDLRFGVRVDDESATTLRLSDSQHRIWHITLRATPLTTS